MMKRTIYKQTGDENKVSLYIKFSVVSLQCKTSISYYELNYQESIVCQ